MAVSDGIADTVTSILPNPDKNRKFPQKKGGCY